MTGTIPQAEPIAVRTQYVPVDLSQTSWTLAVTTDRGERPRHDTVHTDF